MSTTTYRPRPEARKADFAERVKRFAKRIEEAGRPHVIVLTSATGETVRFRGRSLREARQKFAAFHSYLFWNESLLSYRAWMGGAGVVSEWPATADADEMNRCQKEIYRLRLKGGVGILHRTKTDWVLFKGRTLGEAERRERECFRERPDIRKDLSMNGGVREVIRA